MWYLSQVFFKVKFFIEKELSEKKKRRFILKNEPPQARKRKNKG